ncbi:hypothetical protein [Paenibacillus harenae]|uniref:hypothetical protein n=1 Tax=Paenibacillus harenae TaxID=306543 RepID=UPI002793EB66|nr:hypothetical protein [Paenibacillus harenae]MDQ0061395.1 hypothetical protein [Paenibacillus harenae]
MRYTVRYLPLNRIKPGDMSAKITQRIKELRKTAQDCMHMLIVRKSKKEGGYLVISGHSHFDYLKKHTNKKNVACLVDESKVSSKLSSLIHHFRKQKLANHVPYANPERLVGSSWSIIKRFLKQDPRFKNLSRSQKIKVLRLGLQYKKTTITSMKAKVDEFLK